MRFHGSTFAELVEGYLREWAALSQDFSEIVWIVRAYEGDAPDFRQRVFQRFIEEEGPFSCNGCSRSFDASLSIIAEEDPVLCPPCRNR
jgi:hypothetical protein